MSNIPIPFDFRVIQFPLKSMHITNSNDVPKHNHDDLKMNLNLNE